MIAEPLRQICGNILFSDFSIGMVSGMRTHNGTMVSRGNGIRTCDLLVPNQATTLDKVLSTLIRMDPYEKLSHHFVS